MLADVSGSVGAAIQELQALAAERERSPLFVLRRRNASTFDEILAASAASALRGKLVLGEALAVCDRQIDSLYSDDSS
ncbi:hypothetical protein ACQ1ZA_15525, partial [Enterococcus faecalis]|uniref:hypothetical protein n=1 Tax=Enterococcus faecalis TaxID=1351 RepID=UPI003D6C086B